MLSSESNVPLCLVAAEDPAERLNLANQPEYRERLVALLERLKFYTRSLVPAQSQKRLEAADPRYWNGSWTPGWC